jgi:hypothetical protein
MTPLLPTLPRRALAVVAAAGVVAACQTATEGLESLKATLTSANLAYVETRSGGPALPPAPLPEYGVGDAFAFDNNRVHTVAAIDGATINWDAGADFRYATLRNFALPRLSWSWQRNDGTTSSGTAKSDVPPEALWPLKVGNRTAYSSSDTYRDGDGKPSSHLQWWKCWVAGTETVEVPAGRFDTFEIVCDRQYDGNWAQRSRWYYAPAAGHYVRRILDFPGADSQKMDLVAYGPRPLSLPAAANRLRAETVQRTLEKTASGQTVKASAGGYTVAVTPLRTVRTPAGVFCRDYRQEITARSRTSRQQGSACRDDKGFWQSR